MPSTKSIKKKNIGRSAFANKAAQTRPKEKQQRQKINYNTNAAKPLVVTRARSPCKDKKKKTKRTKVGRVNSISTSAGGITISTSNSSSNTSISHHHSSFSFLNLDFEEKLWKAADKLRNNMDSVEYKHVVLGLLFLKYLSDTFGEKKYHYNWQQQKKSQLQLSNKKQNNKNNDLAANANNLKNKAQCDMVNNNNRLFSIPRNARWSILQTAASKQSTKIGKAIDNVMKAIERANPSLKGVLSKDYARLCLEDTRLAELIELISTIEPLPTDFKNNYNDILGRVYEYFLKKFASAEGKKGGQFYTPPSIVRLLVEMLEPHHGSKVFDPCCGSGGMFIQSEKFVKSHGRSVGDANESGIDRANCRDLDNNNNNSIISIYGQESNPTAWRLCKINLAMRGINGDIGPHSANSFTNDLHKDLKADFILANPPFNDSDWNGNLLREDARWKFGVPPANNANFAWVQHFIHHLSSTGMAGFILANGSLSSNTSSKEGRIRKAIVEADLIDCIVALPSNLFYSTSIPVCLWILARNKKKNHYHHNNNYHPRKFKEGDKHYS